MAQRGRPPSAKTLVDRQLGRNINNQVIPAGTEFVIPNHAGDHSAGRVDTTPTQDLDLVNKKYVDDNVFTLPSLTTGSVIFSDGSTLAQDNANLFWANITNRLGIGTSDPQRKLELDGGSENFQFRLGSPPSSYDIGRNTVTGFLTFQGSQQNFTGYNFLSDDDTNFYLT